MNERRNATPPVPCPQKFALDECRKAARALPSAVAATYWLIERGSPAEWWAGSERGWTRDVSEVHPLLRFDAREKARGEADRIKHWPMVIGSELRVTEHMDMENPKAPSSEMTQSRGRNESPREVMNRVADEAVAIIESTIKESAAPQVSDARPSIRSTEQSESYARATEPADAARSETPRTDAVAPHLNLSHKDLRETARKLRDLARQFERELAEAKLDAFNISRSLAYAERDLKSSSSSIAAPACAHDWSRPEGFSTQKCSKCGLIAPRSATTHTSDEEARLLHAVLAQARETLFVSIKGTPEDLQSSLGKLNLACLAHWNWRGAKVAAADSDGKAG